MKQVKQRQISELYDPSLAAELRRIELRTRRNISMDLIGNYRSAFRGSGLIFSDLREYQPGDDIKNIHWKATARTNKVYIKSYEEDRQLNLMLVVDISNSTDFGGLKTKHQRALEFSALISILADKNHDSVGICLFSDQVEEFLPPGKTKNQLQRILLCLLQERRLRQGTDIKQALEYVNKHQRRASVVFLVSDFLSGAYEDQLRLLAYKHDIICVMLEDQLDYNMPEAGIVEFIDAETNQRCFLDTSGRQAKRRFQEMHNSRIQNLQSLTKKLGVDLIAIRDNPLKPLADLMQRRTTRLR